MPQVRRQGRAQSITGSRLQNKSIFYAKVALSGFHIHRDPEPLLS